jgi:uncharacterized membrane protein HdeD (DUF308 family)
MIGDIQTLDIQVPKDIVQYWGWFLAFGVGLLLLGIAAVARSVTATVVSMVFFGWVMLLGCVIEIAQAVMVGHWAGFFLHLLAAVLYGVTGFLMVARPVISAEVVTIFMAMFFLVGGLFQLIGSLIVHLPGWGWLALDGLITIVLGVLVLSQWPASGLWVIGLFVGINLIFYGLGWIAVAFGLRGHEGSLRRVPGLPGRPGLRRDWRGATGPSAKGAFLGPAASTCGRERQDRCSGVDRRHGHPVAEVLQVAIGYIEPPLILVHATIDVGDLGAHHARPIQRCSGARASFAARSSTIARAARSMPSSASTETRGRSDTWRASRRSIRDAPRRSQRSGQRVSLAVPQVSGPQGPR